MNDTMFHLGQHVFWSAHGGGGDGLVKAARTKPDGKTEYAVGDYHTWVAEELLLPQFQQISKKAS